MKKLKLLAFYEKNNWVKYLPWFGSFFEDLKKSDHDKEALARIKSIHARFYFFRNFHRTAPRKYVGGLILNLFGFQIIRILFHHSCWKVRKVFSPQISKELKGYLDTLDNEGVVLISDAFTSNEVQALVNDFNSKTPQFVSHFDEFQEGLILACNAAGPTPQPLGSKVAEDLILKNATIKSLISASSGHQIKLNPEVTYLKYTAKLADLGKDQVDGQDRLHCDVVYPSMKVFVYVTDSNASTGAFVYCPASHKLTLNRLILEYKISLQYFIETNRGEYKPTNLTTEDKKRLNLNERSMEGKAGSVIIFNTMGFHRRGNFTDAAKPFRHVILSNYRYLDSFANKIGWKAF